MKNRSNTKSSGNNQQPTSPQASSGFLAGPAQAKKPESQHVKLKQKASKGCKDNRPCPYAKTLIQMPFLAHKPEWARKFVSSNSEPVRFIMHAMNLSLDSRKNWSMAYQLFHEAKNKKIISYNREKKLWHGREYKHGATPAHILELAMLARFRGKYIPRSHPDSSSSNSSSFQA